MNDSFQVVITVIWPRIIKQFSEPSQNLALQTTTFCKQECLFWMKRYWSEWLSVIWLLIMFVTVIRKFCCMNTHENLISPMFFCHLNAGTHFFCSITCFLMTSPMFLGFRSSCGVRTTIKLARPWMQSYCIAVYLFRWLKSKCPLWMSSLRNIFLTRSRLWD